MSVMPEQGSLERLSREESVRANKAEFAERRERLSVSPRLVTLGTHNGCNAKCVFCLEGQYPRFDMARYKGFFEGKMGHFIRQAEKVTFTGFGEVLWIPEALEFLDYLNETIPETEKIFTTNGTPLSEAVIERLLRSRFVVQISLHAASPELHEKMTLLKGAHGQIISSVRRLAAARRELSLGNRLHLVFVNVVTRQNARELPAIIRLAWELGVPEVQFNYVTMFAADHIEQSLFFDQQTANESIAAAEAELEAIRREADPAVFESFGVRLPTRFGLERAALAGSLCSDPWEHIYVENQGSVLPCCNWGVHIGNLEKGDEIDSLWNGDFYQDLRRRMAAPTPHPWCASCVKYRGPNVDSLLCHLTNRPDQQARLLDEIERRGLLEVSRYRAEVSEAMACVPR